MYSLDEELLPESFPHKQRTEDIVQLFFKQKELPQLFSYSSLPD